MSVKNTISLSEARVEFDIRFRHSTSLNVHVPVAVVIVVLLLVCPISLNYSLFVACFEEY